LAAVLTAVLPILNAAAGGAVGELGFMEGWA
jgi:hypothetical protein